MKKTVLLSLLIIPIFLFSQNKTEERLNDLLDSWHAAAGKADMKTYFDLIDEDGIYIGTDATENWTKQAFYEWAKPYFDKGKAWTFTAKSRNIYLSDKQGVAWFDEKLTSSSGELRGSGVLRYKDGQWKIIHYVLSIPVPNEKFNDVMEKIKAE